MSFDPFGDFATRGYLRNYASEKNLDKVKVLEQASFSSNIKDALKTLSQKKQITFADVKAVHKTLFQDVYPWAGEDRSQNAANMNISKGNVNFQPPYFIGRGVEYVLQEAANKQVMREKPGEILGNLAFAHPFLDGNGRTILTVHEELCRRAKMHIDWRQTNKVDYLTALTREINDPNNGHLDKYLQPFVKDYALSLEGSIDTLQHLKGLASEEKRNEPGPPRNKSYSKDEIGVALAKRQQELGLSDAQLAQLTKLVKQRPRDKPREDEPER